MKIYLVPFMIVLFTGCEKKTTPEIKANAPQGSVSQRDCHCYDGIGATAKDSPIAVYHFSDGSGITVCGYNEDKVLSEFNVFDCKTGTSITEYGATQSCTIAFKNDTLTIYEQADFPIDDTWKWGSVVFAKETIISHKGVPTSSGKRPVSITATISTEAQKRFLDQLEQQQLQNMETDEILGRLEILALYGNVRAENMLLDFGSHTDDVLDGAYAEQYHEALARIKWMKH